MEQREQILKDLAALIAIPSFTEDVPVVRKALEWTLNRAREMGFTTGVTPEGDAGYAEIGTGDVTLGVLAHVDVVGPGDPDKWESDPYELCIRDGILYGRGTEDDKGPVIQSLYAMKAVLDAGVPLKKRIRLIVGTSEEWEWTDMAHYKAHFGTPDYGYSPDAGFPVYNVEKGYADIVLRFPAAGVERLSCGDSPNTIPSKAVIQLFGKECMRFFGVSAHSSVPEQADNAILKLARALPELPYTRFICDMFDGDCHGIRLGVDDGSDHYNGVYVGKTVCSPTILKLDEDKALLNVNIRLRAGVTKKQIEAAFLKHAPHYGYSVEIKDATDPMYVDPGSPFIADMNAMAAERGMPTGCCVASGASYCGTVSNHVGWGPLIPPDKGCAHQENEHVSLEDFWRVLELYSAYLICAAQQEK